jgi:hypothetical protein
MPPTRPSRSDTTITQHAGAIEPDSGDQDASDREGCDGRELRQDRSDEGKAREILPASGAKPLTRPPTAARPK